MGLRRSAVVLKRAEIGVGGRSCEAAASVRPLQVTATVGDRPSAIPARRAVGHYRVAKGRRIPVSVTDAAAVGGGAITREGGVGHRQQVVVEDGAAALCGAITGEGGVGHLQRAAVMAGW